MPIVGPSSPGASQGEATVGPCAPWITAEELCEPCLGMSGEAMDKAIVSASYVVWELSCRQFSGVCTIDPPLRPCGRYSEMPGMGWLGRMNGTSGGYGWYDGRYWDGVCSCNRPRSCGCSRLSEIDLGYWPLRTITEVKVDGVVLDPARYRIDDQKYLVRLPNADGTREGFPCCQLADLPDTEVGTFSVTGTWGVDAPQMGKDAVAKLACELYKSCVGDEECTLPQRIQSLVRDNITFTVLDPFDFLDQGKTGIYEVDLFLKAAAPGGCGGETAIYSPDIGQRARRAGT